MAITNVIDGVAAAVVAATEARFTTTGPFVLYGDGFAFKPYAGKAQERCVLQRLGPDGTYSDATNKDGVIFVGVEPNMVYVDAAGDYQLIKEVTADDAYVGYEEQ